MLIIFQLLCSNHFVDNLCFIFLLAFVLVSDDGNFLLQIRITHIYFKQKTVKLGFRKPVCSFMLDRVLGCHHKERFFHRIAGSVHRDLPFFHHFKQSCLSFCRRSVDLINQDEIRKNRSFFKFKFRIFYAENRGSQNIGRHQIGRKLNSAESYIDGFCQ